MKTIQYKTPFDQLRREAMLTVTIVPQVRRWPDIHDKTSAVPGHLLTCQAAYSLNGRPYTYWRPDLFHHRPQRVLFKLRRRIGARYARQKLASLVNPRPTSPSPTSPAASPT